MTTTTPSIDTMTAEVRVLTIDAKRLTISMYRQLDARGFRGIELFGRVRSGMKVEDGWGYKEEPEIELIGRDSDGQLVRSYVRTPQLPPRSLTDITDSGEKRAAIARWKDEMDDLRRLPLIVLGR